MMACRDIRAIARQTVAPTAEPISVEEAMTHCRIDLAEEATIVAGYIAMARARAERITERQIMPATWVLNLDNLADLEGLRIPYPHLQSVTSITYVDSAGATQTLSSGLYTVDTYREPGMIVPAFGQSWPGSRGHVNDITVTYKAGYGIGDADADTANGLAIAAMPKELKLGMLHYVAHWYREREPVTTGSVNPLPMTGDDLVRGCWHGWQR